MTVKKSQTLIKSTVFKSNLFKLVFTLALFFSSSFNYACGIATSSPHAERIGCNILLNGGNAFDAAIAVSLALGVAEPYGSGIGGGGFFLLKRNTDADFTFIDARETAPKNSYKVDYQTNQDYLKYGPLAIGTPGIPLALDHVFKNYSSLDINSLIYPSIELANQGFIIDTRFAKAIKRKKNHIFNNKNMKKIFIDRNGDLLDKGDLFLQKDLSGTLQFFADHGFDSFYDSSLTNKLVQSINVNGGILNHQDFKSYQIKLRKPIEFKINKSTINSANLPSSGGLILKQILKILESFSNESKFETEFNHLFIEAMKLAYQDRAFFLGDPDFNDIDVDYLGSQEHISKKIKKISFDKVIDPELFVDQNSKNNSDTTHFSIIDDKGNIVSATLSLNTSFGALFVPDGTGIFMNNHLDDFSFVNESNTYGLIGTHFNYLQPFKRPLSSMTPTVLEDDNSILVIGTPGGSRIISMVAQYLSHYLFFPNMPLENIINIPHIHHQYHPNKVFLEKSFNEKSEKVLLKKGHIIKKLNYNWGSIQIVYFRKNDGRIFVINDPRTQKGRIF